MFFLSSILLATSLPKSSRPNEYSTISADATDRDSFTLFKIDSLHGRISRRNKTAVWFAILSKLEAALEFESRLE